jgi:hypothetical protein
MQFAEYAIEHDDLANYLGFAEVALFNVSFAIVSGIVHG